MANPRKTGTTAGEHAPEQSFPVPGASNLFVVGSPKHRSVTLMLTNKDPGSAHWQLFQDLTPEVAKSLSAALLAAAVMTLAQGGAA